MAKTLNLKFMGVDLLHTMSTIVNAHTDHYKSDFDYDREMLLEAADKPNKQDKTFLWLCRDSGTWLLNERNTFIRNTSENNTFLFYAENHFKDVLAYAVEITGRDGDKVIGNLYALDYECHAAHVFSAALMPSVIVLNYQAGTRYVRGDKGFTTHPDSEYGELISYQYLPESEDDLTYLLFLERKHREKFILGNIGPYLERLSA